MDLPFICTYCNRPFCVDHRLPEKHNCPNLIFARPPSKTELENRSPRKIGQPYIQPFRLRSRSLSGSFLDSESQQLVVAWLVLGFCFSIRYLYFDRTQFPLMFLISLATLGLGFIGHELSHRYTARRFGCWAEFRLWPLGLGIALLFAVMSGGRMIFAAPGAVYIVPRYSQTGYGIKKRESGLISLSGPLTNILVAIFFYGLSGLGGIWSLVGSSGFFVNMWLAAFNLIPFGMLDGKKIFAWNPAVWASVAIPAWIAVFVL